MWIKKEQYDKLIERVETLEEYAKNDYKRLEELEETVGSRASFYTRINSSMFKFFGAYGDSEPEPKPLSLWQTVHQIKELLGIETKTVSAATKLVLKPKPTPKAKKASK